MNEEKNFGIAEAWSRRATCPRASVGCVIVMEDSRIVTGGYNGAPEGQPTCLTDGCIIEGGHCVRAVHAEMRAVAYAARHGYALDRTTAFLTLLPCMNCLNALCLCGVTTIYYDKSYEREEREYVLLLAKRAGVRLIERTRE